MRLIGFLIALIFVLETAHAQSLPSDSTELFVPPPPVEHDVPDSVSPWNSGIPPTNCTWGLERTIEPKIELNLLEIESFPNPSSGAVFIEIPNGNEDFKTLTIRNALGQEIPHNMTMSEEGIELTWDSVNGIYFIEIQTSSNIYRSSVILHR